jgi:hypothetical protein
VYSPDGNPINGIVDGYLMSLSSVASLGYSLTRRTSTGVSYTYQRSLHEGGRTSVMSNKDHSAAVNVSQQITRSVSTQGSYRVAKRSGDQAGIQFAGYTHTVTYGFGVSVPITRTRTLAISAGGGATATENGSTERYWQPTYYASLAGDIGRSWVVAANYLQISAMLYSPTAAPDSYLTQSLVISAAGDLTGRLSLVINTGASTGDIAAINSITGSAGRFTGANAGVQLTMSLTDDLSAVGSVNYYRSELSGAANQLMVPASGDFRRAAVRAGLTWDLPLLSTGRVPRAPRRR